MHAIPTLIHEVVDGRFPTCEEEKHPKVVTPSFDIEKAPTKGRKTRKENIPLLSANASNHGGVRPPTPTNLGGLPSRTLVPETHQILRGRHRPPNAILGGVTFKIQEY